MAAFVKGVERDVPGLGFAGGGADRRHLDSVVTGITDHMRKGVLDELKHLAVELGVGAVHDQLDLLTQIQRQVANDSRQLGPRVANRLHARLHDAFLEVRRYVTEPP